MISKLFALQRSFVFVVFFERVLHCRFDHFPALMDDQGEYVLNGYNVITQYPRVFAYGGVTFEYTGTNSTLEKVNTTFARRLKRDLTVEVITYVFDLNIINQNNVKNLLKREIKF